MIDGGQTETRSGAHEAMSDQAILKALENARALIDEYERQKAELSQRIERLRQEAELFERLLQLRQGGDGPESGSISTDLPTDQNKSDQPGTAAVAEVIKELAAANRPLHISELMRVLRDRNVRIPGAGLQANLIIHLSRDSRLVRTSRGMYALANWGLHNEEPRHQGQRKKRFRVSANTEKDRK